MTDGLSLREFLDFRLTAQDEVIDEVRGEVKEIGKSTNGRLKDLETERRVLLAVDKERTKEAEKRYESRWKWGYLTVGVASGGVAGAAFGGLGHALGWW